MGLYIGQEANVSCEHQHQQGLTALLQVTSCLDPACTCLIPFQTPNPHRPQARPSLEDRSTTWPGPFSPHQEPQV